MIRIQSLLLLFLVIFGLSPHSGYAQQARLAILNEGARAWCHPRISDRNRYVVSCDGPVSSARRLWAQGGDPFTPLSSWVVRPEFSPYSLEAGSISQVLPAAINSSGMVLGNLTYFQPGLVGSGNRWFSFDVRSPLVLNFDAPLFGQPLLGYDFATDINEWGQVAGSQDGVPTIYRGNRFYSRGLLPRIEANTPAPHEIKAINNTGSAVGFSSEDSVVAPGTTVSHAVWYRNVQRGATPSLVNIHVEAGFAFEELSEAVDVNDFHTIIGSVRNAFEEDDHGFIKFGIRRARRFSETAASGCQYCRDAASCVSCQALSPLAINAQNIVVGGMIFQDTSASIPEVSITRAFIQAWSAAGHSPYLDLNTLLPADSRYELVLATGIDAGTETDVNIVGLAWDRVERIDGIPFILSVPRSRIPAAPSLSVFTVIPNILEVSGSRFHLL